MYGYVQAFESEREMGSLFVYDKKTWRMDVDNHARVNQKFLLYLMDFLLRVQRASGSVRFFDPNNVCLDFLYVALIRFGTISWLLRIEFFIVINIYRNTAFNRHFVERNEWQSLVPQGLWHCQGVCICIIYLDIEIFNHRNYAEIAWRGLGN